MLRKIFRKKNKKRMKEWEYSLLEAIAKKLPVKYSFLIEQTNSKYILDSFPNPLLKYGWFFIEFNGNAYNDFKKKNIIENNYKISGIKVYDLGLSQYVNIELDISEGNLIGYRIKHNTEKFDINNIKLEDLIEVNFKNDDVETLKLLLGNSIYDLSSYIDIDDTFRIHIKERDFYVIKNWGDGNYLTINVDGCIYALIHDPFKIVKLFKNKERFLSDLKSDSFNISKYYDSLWI